MTGGGATRAVGRRGDGRRGYKGRGDEGGREEGLQVGTPKSVLSAVERCQCATSSHIIHEISSFYSHFFSMSVNGF